MNGSDPKEPQVRVELTLDDFHRWIGELYVECRKWQKAALLMSQPAPAKEEKRGDRVPVD